MSVTVEIITAPAHWACALINGDETGFDYDNDKTDYRDYRRFCAYLRRHGLEIVSVDGEDQEPRFTWAGQVHHSSSEGVMVLDYVTHKIR